MCLYAATRSGVGIDVADRLEVCDRVVGKIFVHVPGDALRCRGGEEQGVPVLRRPGDRRRGDRAGGARAEVHHHRLPEQRRHLVRNGHRHRARDAAGREWRDQRDLLFRIGGSGRCEAGEKRTEQRAADEGD